jgi:hypothetical protein
MAASVSVGASQDHHRPPAPVPRRITFELRKFAMQRSFVGALKAASDTPPSDLVIAVDEKKLPKEQMGTRLYCQIVNFGCFRSEKRFEMYAKENRLRHAHPRTVAAIAEAVIDLPVRIECKAPIILASLVQCYYREGEPYVLSVWWDKDLKRTVRGVPYRYGYEAEYWICFEPR